MPYMTILHQIAVVFFIFIFLLLFLLSLKEKNLKTRRNMIISSLLVSIFGAIISIFVLDKYTKKAKIISYKQKRILSTESVVFNGTIKNIGNFMIGECTIEVKYTNNVMKIGRPKGTFFKPTSSFSSMFGLDKETNPNVVKKEFVVVKNLPPKRVKSFRISMKYPTYMNAPALKLSLSCH